MAKVEFIGTTQNMITTGEKVAGQLVYTFDSKSLYWDVDDSTRVEITDFIELPDEDARLALQNPFEKFYYVVSPSSLWKFKGGNWHLIGGGNVFDFSVVSETEPFGLIENNTWLELLPHTPSINAVFGNNTLTQITLASSLIDANGWDEALILSNLGWSVGDDRFITIDGIPYTLRIAGFVHDDLQAGGKAPISLELAPVCYGITEDYRFGMELTNINTNGYGNSHMRNVVLQNIFEQLPIGLRNIMKPVQKQTSVGGQSSSIGVTTDLIWLFSEAEINGTNTFSFAGEGTQYALYAGGASRIKQQPSGTNAPWGTRSPSANNSTSFCIINETGTVEESSASTLNGVSFGLCV